MTSSETAFNDEELSISDATLIARLRKADEYEPLGHDGWTAADRIEELLRKNDNLFDLAQQEHSRAEQLVATNERLEAALVQCRGLYQVTHIHAAIDAALKGDDHDRA